MDGKIISSYAKSLAQRSNKDNRCEQDASYTVKTYPNEENKHLESWVA